ncbi:spore gernimation protein KA [Paenibacillus yonginensis]|uniref:Spore gernimation protein KA n=1 Tax=Paenibacillus yonginensis TaxID=1462996 RepID=A0A1B1N5L3_9BACL|nr:spore germination protein [Paenibacillus yonginensis]ANS76704.1 spore gernimation protein KA [Paenibacillus yonginensis]
MLYDWLKKSLTPRARTFAGSSSSMKGSLPLPVHANLTVTLELFRSKLGNSPDVIIRSFGSAGEASAPLIAVCYVEGLIDNLLLAELLETAAKAVEKDTEGNGPETAERLARDIPSLALRKTEVLDQVFASVLSGDVVFLMDQTPYALSASIGGGLRRSVEEPTSQTVIRGPKEGFTEDLSTNMALVRRKLKTPALRMEVRQIGTYTQTRVAVAYIEGIAKDSLIDEVRTRLDSIQTDSILESNYIEEMIQDAPLTPFPTIMNTERPDAVAASLLDGQIAIIVDGTPFALIMPVTFFKFFQSSEDYYQRYDLATFLRVLRMAACLVALLLPSLYIAITTFQQEMLPMTMLITLAAQREGTPLPALIEAFVMEMTFEVIREAGVRMPRVIGPAISIVGALVIGQAAVQAGLVSGTMVIVVSFTAIANFVIPSIDMAAAIRLIRFTLMILAGTFGLFGILAGIIPILNHLVSLRSFGVDYFLPYAPFNRTNSKDWLVRMPWWAMKSRPDQIAGKNKTRQAPYQYPPVEEQVVPDPKAKDQQQDKQRG